MPPKLKTIAPHAAPLPILYYKASTGALHQWRVWSEGDTVLTEYGQVDGKMQRTPGKVCKVMNEGQANERSPAEQAASVVQAMHKFKLDRKYALSPAGAEESKEGLPMLAQRFDQRPHHIKFPCDAQPKLDGNRANARWVNGKVELVARSGIDTYDLPHLSEQLAKLIPPGYELDGELYLHGIHPNTINSWVTKSQPESKDIHYCIYDMPIVDGNDQLTWEERKKKLGRLHKPSAPHLTYVPCQPVTSKADIDKLLELWLAQGYEGVMLRNLAGKYAWGERSNDLQKVKVFDDAEFEVVGCREGVGKMAGCAIWTCVTNAGTTDSGKQFDCVCKVPMAERKKQYAERSKYIGQRMTVSYFGFFPTGIPRFPRGIKFRSPKDR